MFSGNQIFQLATLAVTIESAVAITGIGCWTDNANRALQANSLTSGDMTTELCASFCNDYPIFGTEDANQCFCGSQLSTGAIFQDPSWVGCTLACAGNKNEVCGGPWALNLYIH
ncbi:WSC-domain-containing protein [Mollisia scopiformis]|uniref:WSC-domain-containing protein n=1 Tax=Mollisia scopiformis TaxID=149040 RepID=A0A132B624_MOLSC|nr:WSC-domain-containing protein [Mollisia scopiformis]KUJ07852.1 WSC-domain-containing protein [Mollisia scopiformis]